MTRTNCGCQHIIRSAKRPVSPDLRRLSDCVGACENLQLCQKTHFSRSLPSLVEIARNESRSDPARVAVWLDAQLATSITARSRCELRAEDACRGCRRSAADSRCGYGHAVVGLRSRWSQVRRRSRSRRSQARRRRSVLAAVASTSSAYRFSFGTNAVSSADFFSIAGSSICAMNAGTPMPCASSAFWQMLPKLPPRYCMRSSRITQQSFGS